MADDRLNEVDAAVPADRFRGGDGMAPLRRLIHHPWVACLIAGTAAGLLAFVAGEKSYDVFLPRSVSVQMGPGVVTRPTPATRVEALTKNSMVAYAEWGALLGLSLGLAGGLVNRSARRGAVGAVVGAVAGGAVGAILAVTALPVVLRARRELGIDPFIVGSAAQLVIWALIAGAAGAGFGVGSGGGGRAMARGALAAMSGAAVGTLVYAALAALFHPLAETDLPLAIAWQPRLLARLLPTLGAAAALGWSWTKSRRLERSRAA